MASGPDLVQLGKDITAVKLYSVSTTTLWAYDYFLTVGDEIRYAWKTESIPMFTLFLLCRYLPAPFLAWVTITAFFPGYTPEMCNKTAFIESLYYTLITASAQTVMAQRTYAITRKNRWVLGILYAGATAQFIVGVYILVYAAVDPSRMPVIPLDVYQICFANIARGWTIALISISLAFDIVVFVLIVVQTRLMRSLHRGVGVPSILDTVNRDAGKYFTVIASSHFIVVVLYSLGRPGLQGMGMVGNSVLIPMMIVRAIISLKKVASDRQSYSLGVGVSPALSMNFQGGHSPHTVDGVPLFCIRG